MIALSSLRQHVIPSVSEGPGRWKAGLPSHPGHSLTLAMT
jgi:hypothetical protein